VLYCYITQINQNTGGDCVRGTLDGNSPIYTQVKAAIEEDILNGALAPGEQIPSNRQLVALWEVNPMTVLKGVDMLVAEGIIYKKRGMGMFVAPEAPTILRKRLGGSFSKEQIEPLIKTAAALGLSRAALHTLIDEIWEEKGHD
jgi:DNA-binding transcriptional regulator YhcF (GntR family)